MYLISVLMELEMVEFFPNMFILRRMAPATILPLRVFCPDLLMLEVCLL